MKAVLKKYRVNGTQESLIKTTRSVKFDIVGFLTSSLGGKIKNSSNGLNALLTVNIMGNNINAPLIDSRRNRGIVPSIERLSFACLRYLYLFRIFLKVNARFIPYSPTFRNSLWINKLDIIMIANNTVAMAEA